MENMEMNHNEDIMVQSTCTTCRQQVWTTCMDQYFTCRDCKAPTCALCLTNEVLYICAVRNNIRTIEVIACNNTECILFMDMVESDNEEHLMETQTQLGEDDNEKEIICLN